MKNKAIILLSGGLDSLVSLALGKDIYNIEHAITFNYGQKAFSKEFEASSKIAEFYNISHEVINLDWLKNISKSALTTSNKVPNLDIKSLDDKVVTEESARSVWVPNRNALFINIAACYADSQSYTHIIIGANKEEGATFKDNTNEFISAANNLLKYSTNSSVQVVAPLINFDKKQIVQKGIDLKAPFNLVYSCYVSQEKHCGKCESCLRLKRALELNNRYDVISEIF